MKAENYGSSGLKCESLKDKVRASHNPLPLTSLQNATVQGSHHIQTLGMFKLCVCQSQPAGIISECHCSGGGPYTLTCQLLTRRLIRAKWSLSLWSEADHDGHLRIDRQV